MALARVDQTLTAVSTTCVNPDNNTEPMFLVQISFERKKETWIRVRGRPQAFQVDDNRPTAADPSTCFFQIPYQVVAQPASCFHYLAHTISSCSNFVSASLPNYLASKIAPFAHNLVRTGCFGFLVLGDVTIVEETFHAVEPILDTEQATVSRGASKTVLKKERFYMKQGHGDSSYGTTCVVCLEEFSSSVKLTKLPCSHVFHEECIFPWLRNSKSCPLCRSQVE